MNEKIEVGSIVTDKRTLYKFKRKGFIWNYSQWGYLENLRVKTKDNNEFSLYLSSNAKLPKSLKMRCGKNGDKDKQTQR